MNVTSPSMHDPLWFFLVCTLGRGAVGASSRRANVLFVERRESRLA